MQTQQFPTILFLFIVQFLHSQTTLKHVNHFFPDEEQVPVAGNYAQPHFYHGSDIYSRVVEGPIYSKYALEIEISPLFFLDRDVSNIDGRIMYYGLSTSLGLPLSKRIRPNHYLIIEFLCAFDDLKHTQLLPNGTSPVLDKSVRMFSLLANYKWYAPPIFRERIYPYVNFGIGNTFKSFSYKVLGTSVTGRENDSSILTFQGGLGLRARLTNHVGIRTGYHAIFLTHQDYGPLDEDSDLLHALDLGMSLSF